MTDQSYLISIYELLVAHFNETELQTLCFYLGIDYESLVGTAKPGKVMALVQYCQRVGQLAELIEQAKAQRPLAKWPAFPQSQPPVGVAMDLDTLVETLKMCSTMNNRERRDDVVRDLPLHIQGNIERRTALYDDVYNITRTCMGYNDGMAALVTAIKKREGSSSCVQKLETFLQH